MAQLKIASVGELQLASDGRQFFGVMFSAGLGQKQRLRNIFQSFKRDKSGQITDIKIWDRGTREEFIEAMNAGDKVEAEIVTSKVVPYTLPSTPNQSLDTYTAVVFPGEQADRIFEYAGHPMVTEHGEVLERKKAPVVLATATTEAQKAAVPAAN